MPPHPHLSIILKLNQHDIQLSGQGEESFENYGCSLFEKKKYYSKTSTRPWAALRWLQINVNQSCFLFHQICDIDLSQKGEVENFCDLHNSWASFHHTAHYCQHADWQGYPKLRNRSQIHHLHSILMICRVPFGATKGIEEQAVIFTIINCLKETTAFSNTG